VSAVTIPSIVPLSEMTASYVTSGFIDVSAGSSRANASRLETTGLAKKRSSAIAAAGSASATRGARFRSAYDNASNNSASNSGSRKICAK